MSLFTDDFDSLVESRKAIRAFLTKPVPRELITNIIDVARLAPSNSNTQPWTVHIITGRAKRDLSALLGVAHIDPLTKPLVHLPDNLSQKYRTRQEQFGALFYGVQNVDKCDVNARSKVTSRNFEFFGAPVGLIFTVEMNLKKYSWMDYGMFLQTLMLAAQSRGLATCPQVSFARFQTVIADFLKLENDQEIVCAMSLGYADESSPLNQMRMPRESTHDFTHFIGFDQ
ncbi:MULTISPECIES: nitroreductase [Pseudomonas]|uniref:Nitroreductase n=1 Tax=Pseudomonas wuhanensis TaxID=2954098 RepID=A0ABY9GLG7_9PSED|nr:MULTISPECIES: nitroreductase [unclassified Pseudomonas]WLI10676.1 nitroreductase [Pseudomonas sp. FP603]WLI16493.1 nitroreductase [Pseudomonas sp. FP607]